MLILLHLHRFADPGKRNFLMSTRQTKQVIALRRRPDSAHAEVDSSPLVDRGRLTWANHLHASLSFIIELSQSMSAALDFCALVLVCSRGRAGRKSRAKTKQVCAQSVTQLHFRPRAAPKSSAPFAHLLPARAPGRPLGSAPTACARPARPAAGRLSGRAASQLTRESKFALIKSRRPLLNELAAAN